MSKDADLTQHAGLVAKLLRNTENRLVLAESCTAGLVAAALGRIPGVSDLFCGSSVVYRDQTKHAWLNIPQQSLDAHTSVSTVVTREIAQAVLARTDEATLSLGITGHLGPDATPELDGTIHVSIWQELAGNTEEIAAFSRQLTATDRLSRQTEAAALALESIVQVLSK